MFDSPTFWCLAVIIAVLHLVATFRRKWYWPFCYWPMFSTPPSLPSTEAYRIRLCIGDSVQWWKPHYFYRGRNYSHKVHIMLGRVREGEVPFQQVARAMVRNAVILVRTDCPGVDFASVTRIAIVRLTATLDPQGRAFDIVEELVIGFDAPPPGHRAPPAEEDG